MKNYLRVLSFCLLVILITSCCCTKMMFNNDISKRNDVDTHGLNSKES